MSIFRRLITIFLLCYLPLANAETSLIKPFVSGSYQQILQENAGKGFMLVIWSLDCSSCIKDMELLHQIHTTRPALKIVMLSTDEVSASPEIEKLIAKYQLSDLDNWVFADDNSQKLRYQIDPSWYSELPRTYFFNAEHQREGISGALSADEYDAHLKKSGLGG